MAGAHATWGSALLLIDRAKAGIDVRIIGKVIEPESGLIVQKYPGKRLHVRAIVRDGRQAFLGSQSLGRIELDERREIGAIIHDQAVVREMKAVFEQDWAATDASKRAAEDGNTSRFDRLSHNSQSPGGA
jgi:phosphatidylserine/phosphatidylglycerophosphate/cardiolipin synthase-like enzyme